MVQSHTCHRAIASKIEDWDVIGLLQSGFKHMNGFPPLRPEERRRAWCEALVEQNPIHT
jgi:hypothetical protein